MLLCGKEPELKKVSDPKIAVIKFIFDKEDIRKLKKIKENHSDTIYYVSELSDLEHEIVDSSSRYGYYILQCNSMDEVKKIESI